MCLPPNKLYLMPENSLSKVKNSILDGDTLSTHHKSTVWNSHNVLPTWPKGDRVFNVGWVCVCVLGGKPWYRRVYWGGGGTMYIIGWAGPCCSPPFLRPCFSAGVGRQAGLEYDLCWPICMIFSAWNSALEYDLCLQQCRGRTPDWHRVWSSVLAAVSEPAWVWSSVLAAVSGPDARLA